MVGSMSENPALLRYARQLDDVLSEIMDSDAEMGVSFAEVIDSAQNLYVSHEGGRHLVGSLGRPVRPTHVPPLAEDPALHVLTLLAFEISDLPLTVRTIEVAARLRRFKRLSEQLLQILTGVTY